MRPDLAALLVCPRSGAPLDVEILESDGDDVLAGLLHGPAGTFPVVEGIPLLRGGDDGTVDALRRGDVATATALAMLRELSLSRVDAVVAPLLALRPARPVARWLARRQDEAATARVCDALAASSADPDPLLRLTHLEPRGPNPEGYHYFRHRLGLPRHLVALGALAAARPDDRPVVEVGSGAGHLTWQLAAMVAPRRVVAVERQLDLAWVARRHIAPGADVVCGDALALPLADGACSLGVAVDVLSFVTAKATAVRELRRVTGPTGGLVLTSVINASVAHEFAGEPLPAHVWRALAGDDHVALADTTALDAYLAGRTPPAKSDDDDVLAGARTLTLLAGEPAQARLDTALDGWPHATGRLGLHPLLAVVERTAEEVVVAPSYPSPGFARDNPDLARYLPERLAIPRRAVDAALAGELAPAIACAAVLGYPERWPADLWR